MARPFALTVEVLEDRAAPAVFGTPWTDPRHLTLSFAPDGTVIAGHRSTLFGTLNAQEPTAAWQRAILRAVQTWAVNANISVGVVPDGGQPFGTPGPTQGDPRFGDIRIGAQPMARSVLAVSVPLDPYLGGTWSGDILLNSTYNFTRPQSDLYGVMLHEFGHALGLAENGDPTSVLSRTTTAPQKKLSPTDIAALQALYGPRVGDPHEESHGKSTFATATPLSYPTGYDGTAPLAAFGDVTTRQDVDVYSLTSLPGYAGPVTFEVRTAGISLLEPRLTVFDAQGKVLRTAQSANVSGDVLMIRLAQATPGARYYARVDGVGTDVFGIGRYALAVTFDTKLTVPASVIDQVLRGPYDSLEGGDLAEVFRSSDGTVLQAGGEDHTNFRSALALSTTRGFPANQYYSVLDGLDAGSSAYYVVQAPQGTAPVVLTATVNALGIDGVVPALVVYAANHNPVASAVLFASGSTYTIQAANLQPGQSYYVAASLPDSDSEHGGNFALVVDFRQPAELMQPVASGQLTGSAPAQTFRLYVALPQLFGFRLSAAAASAPAGTTVQMTIVDANGNVVDQLSAAAGQTAAPGSALLDPGAYIVHFTVVSGAGAVGGPIAFVLAGDSLSDPIGPVVGDPTQTPLYQFPNDPLHFLYPNGQVSDTPFLWVGLVL